MVHYPVMLLVAFCFLSSVAQARDYNSQLNQSSSSFNAAAKENSADLKRRAAEVKRLAEEQRLREMAAANGNIASIHFNESEGSWSGSCEGGMFFYVSFVENSGSRPFMGHSDLGWSHGESPETAARLACGAQ